MVTPGRSFSGGNQYRYGFNGKENDKDISNGAVAFEARIYDNRLGRFLSTDPLTSKYPWQTPFAYNRNSPISTIDWLGLGDKFFGEKGNFLYESKGKGTGLYLVGTEQFNSLNSSNKNNDNRLTKTLKNIAITAYNSEDNAAKAWAKSGFEATKNDPAHYERGAQIFHAKTTGDKSVSDVFILGNTVVGDKPTNEPSVRGRVAPESSIASLNGKNIVDYTYKTTGSSLEKKFSDQDIDEMNIWINLKSKQEIQITL